MVILKGQSGQLELPDLPPSHHPSTNIIRPDQFTRKKLKIILHLITGELKLHGTKTPHIFLPFRSKIDDSKLEKFLSAIFPDGELINIKDEALIKQILKNFDEFTLICGLKYIWSRLPNHEIIGWNVYLEYKRKEKEAGYPKNAFLSIMPKCLSSPAHASIVYDFLDLLISITANSHYNYLSGRKIAKMSSLWAFNGTSRFRSSPFFDATINKESNFVDGLETWKSSSDALFHLLLSFLRAMLPDNEQETLKLPKTLQSLLITNSYPPSESNDSLKSMITIPCVILNTTRPSTNPFELLSKVRNTLSFDKKDSFLSIENYTILKNIFQKPTTNDIVATLTEESRRILTRITTDPIHSEYDLYPGWLKPSEEDTKTDPNIPLFSTITISDITIQDYYIWTWLSSIGSDQTSHIKNLFGRSLVVEAGLRGFQKWLIITEKTLDSEQYLAHFAQKGETARRHVSSESKEDTPLPPPPPPEKETKPLPEMTKTGNDLLPNINFGEEDSKLNFSIDEDSGHVFAVNSKDELNDYQVYLKSLVNDEKKSNSHAQNSQLSSSSGKLTLGRRRPPPMDETTQFQSEPSQYQQTDPAQSYHYSNTQQSSQPNQYSQNSTQPAQYTQDSSQTAQYAQNYTQPTQYTEQSQAAQPAQPVQYEQHTQPTQQYVQPAHQPAQQANYSTPTIENGSAPAEQPVTATGQAQTSYANKEFQEPYEQYVTEYERQEQAKQAKSEEPFDNYHVPVVQPEQPVYAQTPAAYDQAPYENFPQTTHEEPGQQATYDTTAYEQPAQSTTVQIPSYEAPQENHETEAVSPELESSPVLGESEEARKLRERKKKKKEKRRKEKEEKEMAQLAAMAYGFFPPPPGMVPPPFGAEGLPPIPSPGFFPLPPGLEPESPKKKDKKKKKKKPELSPEKLEGYSSSASALPQRQHAAVNPSIPPAPPAVVVTQSETHSTNPLAPQHNGLVEQANLPPAQQQTRPVQQQVQRPVQPQLQSNYQAPPPQQQPVQHQQPPPQAQPVQQHKPQRLAPPDQPQLAKQPSKSKVIPSMLLPKLDQPLGPISASQESLPIVPAPNLAHGSLDLQQSLPDKSRISPRSPMMNAKLDASLPSLPSPLGVSPQISPPLPSPPLPSPPLPSPPLPAIPKQSPTQPQFQQPPQPQYPQKSPQQPAQQPAQQQLPPQSHPQHPHPHQPAQPPQGLKQNAPPNQHPQHQFPPPQAQHAARSPAAHQAPLNASQPHLRPPPPSQAQLSPQPNQYHSAPTQPAQQKYPSQAPGQAPPALYPPAQHPPAQYPPAQYPPQNYPPQNYPPQGYPQQGAPPAGAPPAGAPPAGQYPSYPPPPRGYYPPPPQGYPQYPPPQGYPHYPPPQGYSNYPPQPYYPPPGASAHPPKQTTSDVAMRGMPNANKFNKNKSNNKADLRAAFNQGSFGI